MRDTDRNNTWAGRGRHVCIYRCVQVNFDIRKSKIPAGATSTVICPNVPPPNVTSTTLLTQSSAPTSFSTGAGTTPRTSHFCINFKGLCLADNAFRTGTERSLRGTCTGTEPELQIGGSSKSLSMRRRYLSRPEAREEGHLTRLRPG